MSGARVGGVGKGAVPAFLVRRQIPLSILALFVWLAIAAARLPGDACYDLANYHLYGPFALLNHKLGFDLAPAQAQGYLPPLNDLPYYLLVRAVHPVRILNVLLSLPEAVALSLVFLLTCRLLRAGDPTTRLLALVATVFGATGAATHPVLATSMSDALPRVLILGALLLLVRQPDPWPDTRPALLAGFLVGCGLGLKLTLSYSAAGIAVGLLVWPGVPLNTRMRVVVGFAAAVVVGTLLVAGWWWYRLYMFSGNPMFPIWNNVFHSPMAPWGNFVDTRFFPRTRLQSLFYPFFWALDPAPLVTEPDQPMRDPRIALGLVAAVILGVWSFLWKREPDGRTRLLAALFVVGYVLWQRQFSIFRYLSLLELLTGPLLALLAIRILRGPVGRQAALNGSVAALFLTMNVTMPPHWGRLAQPGGHALETTIPRFPSGTLVLLLDASPLAFLALSQPADVRFYGVANNLTQPWTPTLMSERIRTGIDAQLKDRPDALWGIDRPDHAFGNADDALAALHLRRGACQLVKANIVYEPIRLCQLVR
jgi:hypothetical protein